MGWPEAILQNLIATAIGVIIGFIVDRLYQRRKDEREFGGWHVEVVKEARPVVQRDISTRKAKEILTESADLSVFVKGVASPYGWINCDVIQNFEEAEEKRTPRDRRLLHLDRENRWILINLDNNPAPPKGPTVQDVPEVAAQTERSAALA